MRLLRALGGVLLWIVSALLGLIAVILCVTVILLPVGIPLLGYAGRLFMLSVHLVLPRSHRTPFTRRRSPYRSLLENYRRAGRTGRNLRVALPG
jgi:hypothetical protein